MINKYFSSIYGEGTGTKLGFFRCVLRKQKEQKGGKNLCFNSLSRCSFAERHKMTKSD